MIARSARGLIVLLIAVATSVAAKADAIVLTFEGVGDNAPIGNFYNGGAGTNYGVSFGADSLAVIQLAHGGSGNFTNNPSGDTVAFFLSGPGDVMNVAAGFSTGVSFFYPDQVGVSGSLYFYSGLGWAG